MSELNKEDSMKQLFVDSLIKKNAAQQSYIKQLEDALEGLIKDVEGKPNDTRYATHLKIAKQALLSKLK